MFKYVHVDEAPPELRSGEFVISRPDFLSEIKENAAKQPKRKLTATNHLRYIVDSIGMKYDSEGTNGWSVRPNAFEGRPFETDEDLSKIVVEMLTVQHPAIFKKYVEHNLKTLPTGTQLVYLVNLNLPEAVSALTDKGFTETTTDDISVL